MEGSFRGQEYEVIGATDGPGGTCAPPRLQGGLCEENSVLRMGCVLAVVTLRLPVTCPLSLNRLLPAQQP